MSNHLWVVFVSKIYYDLALENNSKPSYIEVLSENMIVTV